MTGLHWVGIIKVDELSFRPNFAVADADSARCAAHSAARQLAKGHAIRRTRRFRGFDVKRPRPW
jgi:hypothetical protein